MQRYPEYGYKQESYVIVEEEKLVKEDCVYDNSSSMQMMRPNQCIPSQPHNHHAQPHHGGHHEGTKPRKEGYCPNQKEQNHHHEKMDKQCHGDKRHDGDYKYENSENMHHLNMGGGANGGRHHAPPHMPSVMLNKSMKHYGGACDRENRPYYYEQQDVHYWNSKGMDD